MRVDLDVPYAEKDEAKRLGAWWDAARKTWFVVNREDLTPFAKWFRSDHARPVAGKKHKRNEKGGPTIVGKGTGLPVCACSSPPWEHCAHTSGKTAAIPT